MSSWITSLFSPSSDDDNPSSPAKTTPRSPSPGVQEDLSAVFRGVAAFLAPPPSTASSALSSSSSSDPIAGIKNDLAEIQGSFKSGLSLISSKFTSNFLQFQSRENDSVEDEEEEEEDMVGIDDEVLGFVRKISGRPELWSDFPLFLPDDFDMSDYQREHTTNIDQLVPELVTLRKKICNHISEGKFWLIYFVLLFPRLSNEDLELLSTPEVVEVRETLLKKLQNKTDVETSETPCERRDSSAETTDATKQRETVNEMESEKEDDVSFSDLENDNNDLPVGPRLSESDKLSRDQFHEGVHLTETSGLGNKTEQSVSRYNRSEGEESNDWQTVDDTDFDSLVEI